MLKRQKVAKYNFVGAPGASVDFLIIPKKGRNVYVKKIKVEACGEPQSKFDFKFNWA